MVVLVAYSQDRPFEQERFGKAWEVAGGQPGELRFVNPATIKQVVGQDTSFDGLLLTGGPDVEPARYDAPPHPQTRPDAAREEMDWWLLTLARKRAVPILGICYGCQLLNVFYRGTLIQHLPEVGKLGHRVSEPKDFIAHQVRLQGSRFLSQLPQEFGVNSRHHQAVDTVGTGLKVVALAPDGVVEAIEGEDGSFVLGIQWHPENLLFEPHLELFRRFRWACEERARG